MEDVYFRSIFENGPPPFRKILKRSHFETNFAIQMVQSKKLPFMTVIHRCIAAIEDTTKQIH